MAASLIVYGQKANILERLASAPTLSTSASTSFPSSYLYDGKPSNPMIFSATSSALSVIFDLSIVPNGGMEDGSTASVLDDWTVATGTVVQSTGAVYAGSYAMALTPSTSDSTGAEAYQDVEVHSGEEISVSVALISDGTELLKAYAQNRSTRYYLNSTGGWQAASTYFATCAASTWERTEILAVTVETMRDQIANLRLTIDTTSTGAVTLYADEFHVHPSVDFASVHGHNIADGQTLMLYSSTESTFAAPTSQAAFAIAQPSFFDVLSAAPTNRYWRFLLAGEQDDENMYGELVLAQARILSCLPLVPQALEYTQEQARAGQSAYLLEDRPTRTLAVTYTLDSTAQADELRDVYRVSGAGVYPVVFVPLSTEDVALYGRLAMDYTQDREDAHHGRATLTVTEMGLPTVTP